MTTLPIRTLTLYKQGIGYFERAGSFRGTNVLLVVPRASTNDVLKSLQLEITHGEPIQSVDYETPEDKQHILDQLAVKLGTIGSLSDLLTSLRGYVVTCQRQDASTTGRIVGVELITNQQSPLLVLQAQETLHTLPLASIERFVFEDQRARDSLAFFLDVSQSEQTSTTLTLRFPDGDHSLRMSYLAPSPTWRMSYRLLRDASGTTRLQAWGLFDNALDEDLDAVQITLISGRPISFEYELYATSVPARPHVSDEPVDEASPQHDRGFRDFVSTVSHELRTPLTSIRGYADLLQRGMIGTLSEQQREFIGTIKHNADRMTEHLSSLLDAMRLKDSDTGRYFALSNAGPLGDLKVSGSYFAPVALEHAESTYLTYPIASPISVKRGQSAMVPIFDTVVPCDVLCVYNGDKMANHPLLVWRITNTSGVVLEQGPATLSTQNVYQGEALLRFTGVNEQRELAYALEYGILVSENRENDTEQLWRVDFDKHARQKLETAFTHDTIYTVVNRLQRPMDVLIERRRSPQAIYIDSPAPSEEFPSHQRWTIRIAAQATTTIVLRERSIRAIHSDLRAYTPEMLASVRAAGLIDQTQDALLSRLLELHAAYSQTEAATRANQQEYAQLLERQEQLRKNLAALGQSERETSVRNRVLDDLERSEERRRTLEQDAAELNLQLQRREAERQTLYGQLAQTSEDTSSS